MPPDLNHSCPPITDPPPSPDFLPDELACEFDVNKPENIYNGLLSESSLRKLHLECFDECVYNDLPQYLIRIHDMKLCSRIELWKTFRPLLDTTGMCTDVAKASHTVESSGEAQLRKDCKDDIKGFLKYAIASHRWGEEEPEFRDMSSKIHGQRPTPEGTGYRKLVHLCEKAREYGCEYVWSDTCCINKESSSELEEAIRSMYRWYRDAFVCIVHLAKSSCIEDFAEEPWFTRGWTLQELLAPEKLRMYGEGWDPICPEAEEVRGGDGFPFPNDKLSNYMLQAISNATRIQSVNIRDFNSRSRRLMVSTKMRWAAKRKTTRIEDIAYSLLGIFDITMPIAYGEGDHAFLRLLEAIAQRSGDPSFFAWAGPCSRYSLALPDSPASYQIAISKPCCEHGYTIQKRGIHLRILVIPVKVVSSSHHYTLQPLYHDITIIGQFKSSPSELCLEHSYAVGVIDFQLQNVDPRDGRYKWGWVLPGRRHFGILIRFAPLARSQGTQGATPDLICRRIDTKGVLPLVESRTKCAYGIQDVLLIHSPSVFI